MISRRILQKKEEMRRADEAVGLWSETKSARWHILGEKKVCPDFEARLLAAKKDYPAFAALLDALNGVDTVRVLAHDCKLPCIRLNVAPQIRFEASVAFARGLRKEVLADGRREEPELRAPWDVLVVSEDVLRTVFELSCRSYLDESSDRHENSRRYCALLGLFNPENLAHDFAVLTKMVEAVGHSGTPNEKEEQP